MAAFVRSAAQSRELWRSSVEICFWAYYLFKSPCHDFHFVGSIQYLFWYPACWKNLLGLWSVYHFHHTKIVHVAKFVHFRSVWSFVNVEILLSPPAWSNTVFTSDGLWRFWFCPLFLREITDVLVSVSADQESPLTSLWLYWRMRMFGNGSWNVTSWRLIFIDWPESSGVGVAVSDFGFLVGAARI